MAGGTPPCVPPCFKKVNLKPSLAKTHAEVSRRVIVTLALGVQVAKKLPLTWVAEGGCDRVVALSVFIDTETLCVIFYRETVFLPRRKPRRSQGLVVAKPMNEMKLQREPSSGKSVSSAVGEA